MSTKMLQVFGGCSMPQPVMSSMPVDLAMRLCLSQSPPLCQLLRMSSLKPLRPCIQPQSPESETPQSHPTACPSDWTLSETGISGDGTSTKKKRVVFADSKGLSLTAVHVFSEREEPPRPEPSPSLRLLRRPAADRKHPGGARKPPLRLGFQQPLADFQSFRARLQEDLVLLESCSVTERALSGTVQVKNVSFQKAVHVRVTFDSWRSWRDVPCAFLQQQRYGGSDTDVFAFHVPLPEDLDPRERLEFCVSYLPGSHSTALWDNNKGQNYSVVCGECEAPPSAQPITSKQKPGRPWAGQSQSKEYAQNYAMQVPSPYSYEILVNHSWGRLGNISPFW
ncbi:protein phosphatase 1 regulatory subunit 3C [Anguilla anguilla]|uniref:protein phosphatase 1 regulatory subunit 3C n=1 Tax=Anguilla anguilla TaxID=7936 RepID=UPI0015ACD58E|nr:protein phosphatase 1 regulatory subunit 3C [Anguilla anguilla]